MKCNTKFADEEKCINLKFWSLAHMNLQRFFYNKIGHFKKKAKNRKTKKRLRQE